MPDSDAQQTKAPRVPTLAQPNALSSAHELSLDYTALDQSIVQRSLHAPETLTPGDVQRLQRHLGNQTVQRLLKPEPTTSLSSISPKVQRHPSHAEEEEVQRKTWGAGEQSPHATGHATGRIQRHPGHAGGHEGEVEARRTLLHSVQRHPSHAEEEEVQRKTLESGEHVQRAGFFSGLGKGAKWLGQKGLQAGAGLLGGVGGAIGGALGGAGLGAYGLGKKGWNKGGNVVTKSLLALGGGIAGAIGGSAYGTGVGTALGATRGWEGAKFAKGTQDKEQALSQKYGVPIGGEGRHFNSDILKEVEGALESLPEGNVGGSWLRKGGIAPNTGSSALASFYAPDDKSIAVGSPWWLPKRWHRNMKIGKKTAGLMDSDEAAVKMDALSIKARYPSKEDQATGGLSIFRGIGDVHEGRQLLPYTIRHEMGHAVDHKIKFTKTRGRLKQFGGWIQHGGDEDERGVHDDANSDRVIAHFMAKEGLSDDNLKAPDNMYTSVSMVLDAAKQGNPLPLDLDRYYNNVKHATIDGETIQKMRRAERKLLKARNSPWMLNDGGAGDLKHNGRVIHLDHYNTWVSYDADERTNHGVSNYQFSSPGEWFAEAYAVYYEPDQGVGVRGRNRLNEATKSWLNKNLGPYPGQDGGRGDLVVPPDQNNGKYWLKDLPAMSVEKMAELNNEGNAVNTALPADLLGIDEFDS
ncbi:MAG: hypothetical protein WDZ49_14500 [Litorilinea sp.]